MTDITTLLKEPRRLAREGKFDGAADAYQSIIEQLDNRAYGARAVIANERGVIARMKRDYTLALDWYDLALDLSKRAGDNVQSALAFINMADIDRVAHNDAACAHANLDEALSYAPHGSLVDAQARDQRGLVFVGQRIFDCALESYQCAQDIAEQLFETDPEDKDVQNRLGQILHHIGAAYVHAKDTSRFDAAYASQQKALEIFEKLRDAAGIANTVSTMGHLALAAGRYDEVVAIGERAWGLVTNMAYERGIRTVALNLAEAHLQLAQPAKAEPYLAALEENIGQLGDNDAALMEAQFKCVIDLYRGHAISEERLESVLRRFS